MKKISWLFAALCTCILGFSQNEYSRVKILANNAELAEIIQLGVNLDHGTHKSNVFYITDLSATEINTLEENGYSYEILIEDVKAHYVAQNVNPSSKDLTRSGCGTGGGSSSYSPETPANWSLGSMGGYYTYQEYLDNLDAMRTLYPNLITAKSGISTFQSHEGRPIYWVRISDNADTDEAEEEVLYTAIHHAREPGSLSQLIFYMWYLLENYGTDDEITYLVDNTEMYFVPMINPDGYVYNETTDPNGGGMHRKNRNPAVGTTNKGVDLNRNYSYEWNESGTSPNPNNDTYAGSGPFSEPETQAIKWFCENREFVYASNAHSYGNLVLFPFGWSSTEYAVDHDYFQAYTNHMALFSGYSAIKSSGLYPAAGDSDDYMYVDDPGVKAPIFAITPEIGSDAHGFWPPQSEIENICQENVWMNKTMAHLPHIYGYTTDLENSKIEEMSGYFSYEIERLGLENGDLTVSITPIQNIQTIGGANVHSLTLMEIKEDSIAFDLEPTIQFGDEIIYVLHTDNGSWINNDTIVKTFGAGVAIFTDDCSNTDNWTGDWSYTNEDYVSPSNCITDSPYDPTYSSNLSSEMELNETFSFMNATYAYITFNAKWEIENDWDYVEFMISTDGGSNWTPLCGKYTNEGTSNQTNGDPVYDGFQTDWVLEEIDLSDYIDMSNIKFMFRLTTDQYANEDGFYFDDFSVYTDAFDDTGTEELTEGDIQLYPNPSNSSVSLVFTAVDQVKQIEIYNELGAIKSVIVPTNNTTTIAVDEWPAGIYLVKVMTENGEIITKRFTVLR